MRALCYLEVGWVLEIWGVTFLVVPPKDKFALLDLSLLLNLYLIIANSYWR